MFKTKANKIRLPGCPFQSRACKCLHLHQLLVSCEPWLMFVWGAGNHIKRLCWQQMACWLQLEEQLSKKALIGERDAISSSLQGLLQRQTERPPCSIWVKAVECWECLLHVMCETCHPLTSHWPVSLSALSPGGVYCSALAYRKICCISLLPNSSGSAALMCPSWGVGGFERMQCHDHAFPLVAVAHGCWSQPCQPKGHS